MVYLIIAFVAIAFTAIVLIPVPGSRGKGYVAVSAAFLLAIISSIPAVKALSGSQITYDLPGSLVTGVIPVRIDALSGWFMLILNFTFLTGGWYGFHYMKVYREQTANLSLHWISFVLTHAALLSVCVLQNSIAFLVAWEIMALSAFIMVIFEHQKRETLKAGLNYLIQSHVGILFLMLAFIWVAWKENSFDFSSIRLFSEANPNLAGMGLFLFFFVGFAIKAGFVPFHTWLPHAHPAAPSHVSGMMSGVIIKIGIYGILRMILLIKTDYITLGYIVLFLSVVSGVYGVMLAILQHNLKKLLAYHSIENIGIIGIGIGVGCIGIGSGNQLLTVMGFAGSLLHTLNHSLFKSLLFYGAGNIYQATHLMQIDKLGGLIKKMPQTAILFLLAALAICGLPPFNGFVSEFLIYSGMFSGLKGASVSSLSLLVFSISGLTLIGGLALLCFTKAFGVLFLGQARVALKHPAREAGVGKLIPLYAIAVMIVAIGFFPQYIIRALNEPVKLFANLQDHSVPYGEFPFPELLNNIGFVALLFSGLALTVFLIRKVVTSHKPQRKEETWGCGYVSPGPKIQYTASSFVRTYRKLAEPVLLIHKHKKEVEGVFPSGGRHDTHPDDKMEQWLIIYPLTAVKHFFNRLTFLQNGNPQVYILYGIIFIIVILGVPMIFEAVKALIQFLNQL